MTKRMTNIEASQILAACDIDESADYFTLTNDQKRQLLTKASERGYRRPRNANGSTSRYFHAYVIRALNSNLKAFAVTVTTYETYKVLARDQQHAKDMGLELDLNGLVKPKSASADINAESW